MPNRGSEEERGEEPGDRRWRLSRVCLLRVYLDFRAQLSALLSVRPFQLFKGVD